MNVFDAFQNLIKKVNMNDFMKINKKESKLILIDIVYII